MSVPKSVVRFKKGNVEYVSSVDRVQYTIRELTRAALRDVGKYVCRMCNAEAMKLPGMKKSKRVRGKTSAFQYWARKEECDLQVGIKHGTWYGEDQELGSKNQPKRGILRNSSYNNVAKIVEIESQYLSALEDEARALALIESEDDYQGGADDE